MRRFVIVSYPRSGTHWLRTALETSPAIRCLPEAFNANNPELPWGEREPPSAVLQQIWARLAGAQAGGFVVHGFHPGGLTAWPGRKIHPAWATLWDDLDRVEDLHVIHLFRADLLARYLSHHRAYQTKHWANWTVEGLANSSFLSGTAGHRVGAPAVEGPVRLDPAHVLLDFEEVERHRAATRAWLGDKPHLEVRYEDLIHDFEPATARIQRFLAVEPTRLHAVMHRLETRPLEHAIANLDELHAAAAHTRWSSQFERSPDGRGAPM